MSQIERAENLRIPLKTNKQKHIQEKEQNHETNNAGNKLVARTETVLGLAF